jgi:hypothetical protein
MPYGDAAWRTEKRLAMPPGVCSNFPYCSRLASAGAKRCGNCLERIGAWRRNQRKSEAKMPGACSVHECKAPVEPGFSMCGRCREGSNAGVKARNRKLKAEVFAAYGDRCVCCSEAEPSFLSVDHINGYDGTGPRKSIPLYRWLKKNGHPAGFQLLCMNCNTAKSRRGCCPHAGASRDILPAARQLRDLVLSKYGGSACRCCGESNEVFMCIDHVNNDGAVHRRKVGATYPWLVRNNFPGGFQVLCFNCNFSKGHLGECSHVTARKDG